MPEPKRCHKCGGLGPFSASLRTKDGFNRACDGCLYVFSEKACSRCHQSGLMYGKIRNSRDGLNCYCVSCHRERGKQYRETHREVIIENKKQWNASNPKKGAEYAKANYASRTEEARQERRDYYARNKDHMNARVRQNYHADRESRLIVIAAWKEANPERLSRSSARRRGWLVEARGDATIEQVEARIAFFGGMCAYCGMKPWKHLDHAIPISRGGTNWPSNLRPACAKCNLSKNAQVWFLITLEPIRFYGTPVSWMREREKKVYVPCHDGYKGMIMRKLAERFEHAALTEHAEMCDDCTEDELADLLIPEEGTSEYNNWFHVKFTSGAFE